MQELIEEMLNKRHQLQRQIVMIDMELAHHGIRFESGEPIVDKYFSEPGRMLETFVPCNGVQTIEDWNRSIGLNWKDPNEG